MRLRVLHVISGDLWAGAEVATYHLIRALCRRDDVDVRVLVLTDGVLARRLREAGVAVEVEPESQRGFPYLLRATRRLARGADLLHAHRYKENLLAAGAGRPWVTTQHGRPESFKGLAAVRGALYSRLDFWAKRHSARRVLAVSSEIERWLTGRLRPATVVRVWNGIHDPVETLQPLPWSRRRRCVGVVARLVPVKNLSLAIDVVAACHAVEFEIVGDGPQRNALERRAAASGAASRIRLVGFEENPLARIAQWRALLMPSLHEGNPISVLEALALGTPVFSASLPGVEEILGGEGGWVLRSRDPRVWAQRLSAVLDDEEGGEAASRSARGRYEAEFTAAKAAARTVSVYRAALAETYRSE